MKFHIPFYILLLALTISACSGASPPQNPQIEVDAPWVRAAAVMSMQMDDEMSSNATSHMGGGASAAYLTIRNNGQAADRLINVHSDVAEFAEIHTSQTTEGVTSMEKVDSVEIPAQGTVVLEPGGMHIMLIGLKRDLQPGDTIQLTLEFEQSSPLEVQAEVRLP